MTKEVYLFSLIGWAIIFIISTFVCAFFKIIPLTIISIFAVYIIFALTWVFVHNPKEK